MKRFLHLLVLCFLAIQLPAQKNNPATKEIKIPMEPSFWEYDSSLVQFIMNRNVKAVKPTDPKGGYMITLKNQDFSNGTIEFDVELTGMGFPGINFRMSPDKKNGDNFYIRSFGPVTPETRTTLQYAAIVDGMSLWDITDEYQAGATIYQEGWNHVKLVISGKQMKAYVNDMAKPALWVPELEGGLPSGSIFFTGNVIYANLVLKPNTTEGLDPLQGYISTYNDPRYLRSWLVGPSLDYPVGKEPIIAVPSTFGRIEKSDVPDSTASWEPLIVESRGMLNLTRKFGNKAPKGRRLAWIKTVIQSDKAQEKILRLGISDEAWVFINGQILYVDKNYFGTPEQKEPRGRCTIENTSVRIPLKEGKNEIMIGLGNLFYAWAIIARFDDTDGLRLMK